MRALVAAGLFLTGAIAMSTAVADAQDKKAEKFPERVSFRKWDPSAGGRFINPTENLKAAFRDDKGGVRWLMPETPNGDPTLKSEITSTDKDGNKTVWVVTKVEGGGATWVLYVTKQDTPKKE
jgi:hypothetical protein